jgi:hypothetical protein
MRSCNDKLSTATPRLSTQPQAEAGPYIGTMALSRLRSGWLVMARLQRRRQHPLRRREAALS